MKHGLTLFLKFLIVLIAAVVLTGMIRFPQTEGRAANLDLISIYSDPLIIYGYIASVPFFMALYQAFILLGYIEKNKLFSHAAVKAMRTIKNCAIVIPFFIMAGGAYIVSNSQGEDFAGAVALGIYASCISLIIATTVAFFEKRIPLKIRKTN